VTVAVCVPEHPVTSMIINKIVMEANDDFNMLVDVWLYNLIIYRWFFSIFWFYWHSPLVFNHEGQ
jgi:hypothetical protein